MMGRYRRPRRRNSGSDGGEEEALTTTTSPQNTTASSGAGPYTSLLSSPSSSSLPTTSTIHQRRPQHLLEEADPERIIAARTTTTTTFAHLHHHRGRSARDSKKEEGDDAGLNNSTAANTRAAATGTMKFPSLSPFSSSFASGRTTAAAGKASASSSSLPLTSATASSSSPSKGNHRMRSHGGTGKSGGSKSGGGSIPVAAYVQRAIVVLVFLRFSLYLMWMHTYLATDGTRILDNTPPEATNDGERLQRPQQQPLRSHRDPGGDYASAIENGRKMNATEAGDETSTFRRRQPRNILQPYQRYVGGGVVELPLPLDVDRNRQQEGAGEQDKHQVEGKAPEKWHLPPPDERVRERQARTRPPAFSKLEGNLQLLLVSPILNPLSPDNPGLPRSTVSIPDTADWSQLCRQAGLDKNSRLAVTNVLSNEAGTPLVLLAAAKCGVRNVIGIDTIFPNVRKSRMPILDQNYRRLLRSVSNFILHVPMHGLAKRKGLQQTLQALEPPTHIVHLDGTAPVPSGPDDGEDDGALMEADSRRLYSISHSLLTWEHALTYALKKQMRPAMVHASVPTDDATGASLSAVTSRLGPCVSMAHLRQASGAAVHLHFGNHTGPLVGPLIRQRQLPQPLETDDDDRNSKRPVLFVDDAVAAIMQALGRSLQQQRNRKVRRSPTIIRAQSQCYVTQLRWRQALAAAGPHAADGVLDPPAMHRVTQTVAWERSLEFPFGFDPFDASKHDELDSTATSFLGTYGIQPPRFPCSSTCSSTLASCRSSAWDVIRPISQQATSECRFVVYIVDLSQELDEIVEPTGGEQYQLKSDVCRIGFVSGRSTLVQTQLAERTNTTGEEGKRAEGALEQLELWNGKIEYNQWTLIWLPNDDDASLNDSDTALPRIDPSGMFSETVNKALYAELQGLVEPSDYSLARIMSQIDRPALGSRKVREGRMGTQIARWVRLPPEPARHSIFFAGEPKESLIPKSIRDFVKIAGDRFHFPARQLTYYEQISHLVQTNDLRPEPEIRSTIYFSFPFQWITMSILIHDMRAEASRQLRCSWYDEYLHWGSGNRNAEELSFAYVMGKRRITEELGPSLEDDASWLPLMRSDGTTRKTNPKGSEFFVRLLKHREPREGEK